MFFVTNFLVKSKTHLRIVLTVEGPYYTVDRPETH